MVGAGIEPAGAQPAPTLAPTAPPPIEVDGLDPVLDAVAVDETEDTRRADGRYVAAQQAEGDATLGFVAADRNRIDLITRSADADRTVAEAEGAVRAARDEVAAQEAELAARQQVAAARKAALVVEQDALRSVVSSVFTSEPSEDLAGFGTFEQMTVGRRRQDVRDRTVDIQSDIVDEHDRSWRTARGAVAAQERRLDRAEAALTAREAELADATSRREDLGVFLQQAQQDVQDRLTDLAAAGEARLDALVERRRARLLARVDGLDLTLVALDAYWRASGVAPCAIPWWILAGVGKVETHHGTAHGSQVGADGLTSVRILGIALDGRPGVAAIGDSDGGLLDGDGTWDRAVGPMQFIPGTWRRWAGDGNGDGTADPHNLYDAAAAAANYLCFGRVDLADEAAARVALLSYNRSVPYGTKVLAEGRAYREALDLPDRGPAPLPAVPG